MKTRKEKRAEHKQNRSKPVTHIICMETAKDRLGSKMKFKTAKALGWVYKDASCSCCSVDMIGPFWKLELLEPAFITHSQIKKLCGQNVKFQRLG